MKAQEKQVSALSERLKLEGDRVPLWVIPQHPIKTPDPVEVKVKAPINAGPVGANVAVFDYDRERDRITSPSLPDGPRSFPRFEVSDPHFHQLNAYAIAARAIDLVEYELGRLLTWGFEASRLIVLPHAGYMANAFFEEATHSLQLYSFRQPDGSIYHTSLVHDVVAHETGHALLDAVRDRYTEGNHRETAALHEAVGDLTAVFAAFSHEVVRAEFLKAAGPTLRGPNQVTSIADDFEASPTGSLALRDISAPVDPATFEETSDPHILSLKLTGAVWECLIRMYDAAVAHGADAETAFSTARSALQRMVVRGFDYLPPADATFAEFASAIYRADRFAHPDDSSGFRAVVANTFSERGIVPNVGAIVDESAARGGWSGLPATWPRPTLAEAYVFLDQNRNRLALSTQPKYRDFVVRDLQVVSRPPNHAAIDAVVISYEYPVDIELPKDMPRDLAGYWLPIWGGGTLVFDADGALRHHAEKPVTKERVRDVLAFIHEVVGTALVRTVGSQEDRLVAGASSLGYVATIDDDRLTIRSNPAARCGSHANQGLVP
jgi:hypothetical protein